MNEYQGPPDDIAAQLKELEAFQAECAGIIGEGTDPEGLAYVSCDSGGRVSSLRIDERLALDGNADLLESAVLTAFDIARANARMSAAEALSDLAAGRLR